MLDSGCRLLALSSLQQLQGLAAVAPFFPMATVQYSGLNGAKSGCRSSSVTVLARLKMNRLHPLQLSTAGDEPSALAKAGAASEATAGPASHQAAVGVPCSSNPLQPVLEHASRLRLRRSRAAGNECHKRGSQLVSTRSTAALRSWPPHLWAVGSSIRCRSPPRSANRSAVGGM